MGADDNLKCLVSITVKNSTRVNLYVDAFLATVGNFMTETSAESQPVNGEASPGAEEKDPAPITVKRSLKLSYEEYRQMGNLLVLHMRRQEEQEEGKCFLTMMFFPPHSQVLN